MRVLCAILLFVLGASVQAAPVTWTLNNVVLSDGQSLTGGFAYDFDAGAYSSVSIMNSGSVMVPAMEWDTALSGGTVLIDFISSPAQIGDTALLIGVTGGLSSAGGTLDLFSFGGVFGTCTSAGCATVAGSSAVQIVSGTISAVPIPAAVWLFGSALAGLGWFRKKSN